MSETSVPDARRECLNCGQPMEASFCAHCGQEEKQVKRPFILFVQEFLWVVFELDGRAYRTLGNLLIRPGFLTLEYFAGRRVKYTPPLRLFLIISIGFFLIVSLFASIDGIRQDMADIAAPQETRETTQDPEDNEEEGGIGPGLEDVPESENYDEVIAFLERVSLPFFAEETNRNLQTVLVTQFETNIEELTADPRDFLTESLEYVTIFVLLMMPILALIQQILWVLSRRYYVEHLVLTVHNHAFLILMVFLTMVLGIFSDTQIPLVNDVAEMLSVAAVIWIFIYLYLSLKRYFGSGWFITAILYLVATTAYSIVLTIGLVAFAVLLVLFA